MAVTGVRCFSRSFRWGSSKKGGVCEWIERKDDVKGKRKAVSIKKGEEEDEGGIWEALALTIRGAPGV
jgi:hypothetical protein